MDTKIKFSTIMEEYAPSVEEDDDKIYKLKEVINSLSPTDKALLILYAEEQSMAKTGKKLGVSAATIYLRMQKIRTEIISKLC